MKEQIEKVDEFILKSKKDGVNVYILDASAAMYMIPLNIYNKDFDLFLNGNLGTNFEEKFIEKVSYNDKVIYLIKKGNRNWQSPEILINCVMNNFENAGEIEIFDIYEVY